MAFTNRKSIHGRQLALSSTGGIISSAKLSGTHNSTTYDMAAQMWGAAMVTNITSTGGATLTNAGVDTIATTATAATFLIAAPVAGVSKEIYVTSSASALTFGGTSTAQVFMKVAGGAAGSTTLTLTDVSLAGTSLILRGLSTTQWGVLHGSTAIQA